MDVLESIIYILQASVYIPGISRRVVDIDVRGNYASKELHKLTSVNVSGSFTQNFKFKRSPCGEATILIACSQASANCSYTFLCMQGIYKDFVSIPIACIVREFK